MAADWVSMIGCARGAGIASIYCTVPVTFLVLPDAALADVDMQ